MDAVKEQIPACLGIIMDGNRRWAQERSLSPFDGHQRGYEKFKEAAEWAKEVGIKNLIVYAFSTENWNRSEKEVGYLLDLFKRIITEEVETLKENGTRVIFAGDIARFPKELREEMERVASGSRNDAKRTLVIALSYGGRAELLQAIEAIRRDPALPTDIPLTETDVEKYLWTAGIPDPDMIIRTGGEIRLSNFLPWQSTYSELFFTSTYWPDFSRGEFDRLLAEFAARTRRMGK